MNAVDWRPCPGYLDTYDVSSVGDIRRRSTGRILRLCLDQAGRPSASLTRAGKSTTKVVCSLVAVAFLGPRPPAMLCCHRDGDPANNAVGNLYWGTYVDNARDAVRHGTNAHAAREICPLGHALRLPNLVAAKLRVGHRNCLACGRARSRLRWLRSHGQDGDFKQLAHGYYKSITMVVAA